MSKGGFAEVFERRRFRAEVSSRSRSGVGGLARGAEQGTKVEVVKQIMDDLGGRVA